jgi:hypothetical protein
MGSGLVEYGLVKYVAEPWPDVTSKCRYVGGTSPDPGSKVLLLKDLVSVFSQPFEQNEHHDAQGFVESCGEGVQNSTECEN